MPQPTSTFGLSILLVTLLCLVCHSTLAQSKSAVNFRNDPEKEKIEVWLEGKLFTIFHYDRGNEKPVLYPILSSGGNKVTRHHPGDPKAGERVDHPHHLGMWLNYGDVNGLDFWNNSSQKSISNPSHYGWIRVSQEPTFADDQLSYAATWETHEGEALLKEETVFSFRQTSENRREIIRSSKLTAITSIDLTDNKEGLLGLRLTRALEHPTAKAILLSNPDGSPRDKPQLENNYATGQYTSPTGLTGTEVWGTRAPWMTLSGNIDGEKLHITIFDHPDNPGYPTYWHARGYGLFAANPLGQAIFSEGKESLNLSLAPNETITFRYLIGLESSSTLDQSSLKKRSEQFAKEF